MIRTVYGDFAWVCLNSSTVQWMVPVEDVGNNRVTTAIARLGETGNLSIYIPPHEYKPQCTVQIYEQDPDVAVLDLLIERGVVDPLWLLSRELK